MEWLTQNWLLVALAIGAIMLMRRGAMGCGHGSHGSQPPAVAADKDYR